MNEQPTTEPDAAGSAATKSAWAAIDEALERGEVGQETSTPAVEPATIGGVDARRPAVDRAADTPAAAALTPLPSLRAADVVARPLVANSFAREGRTPRRAVAAQPDDAREFTKSAEYRSRLSWFIGVSDGGAVDPGSLTYEQFFGLREKPFSLTSDPRFFCSHASHGAAFDTLASGIRRREGILVLTGEVGTGKTTVCRAVLQSLDQKTFAAFVPDPFLSREDLLKTLLVEFGIVSVDEIRSGRLRGATRTDLSYPLYDFLASLQPLKAFAVVMIDEAQNLTAQLLEEIRILSDLEHGQRLLEVVLVGQPELQSRLATPAMRQLRQRVSIRCDLAPLGRADVKPYVSRRLTIAGSDGRVQFTDAALGVVYAASQGIPRVVNLVCDRALLRAAQSRTMNVDAEHARWAVADLQLSAVAETAVPASIPPELSDEGPMAAEPFQVLDDFVDFPAEPLSPQDPVPNEPAAVDVPVSSMALPRVEAVETTVSLVPEADTAPPVVDTAQPPLVEEAPATGLFRRRRLLELVVGCLLLTAGLAGYWGYGHSRSKAPQRPSNLEGQSLQSDSRSQAPPVAAVKLIESNDPRAEESARATSLDGHVEPGRVEPKPAESQSASVKDGHTATQHAIQVATFGSPVRTAQAVQQFRDAGYPVYSVEVHLRDGQTAQAVLLGPYAELESANRDLERAKQVPGYGSIWVVEAGPALLPQPAQR